MPFFQPGKPSISFEFFPPKTEEKAAELMTTISQLEALHPTFVSVTYGAGGSTRDRTIGVTRTIAKETSLIPMAHMTCVNATKNEIKTLVGDFKEAGVNAIMALRGDPVGGIDKPWEPTPDGFNHASELVQAIREWEDPANPTIIGVAAFPEGHPESPTINEDAKWLAHKFEVGADFAVTQMFFDVQQWADLRDRVAAHGQTKPIIPGIMPITSAKQLERMVKLSGGTVAGKLYDQVLAAEANGRAKEFGIAFAVNFCIKLLELGAPGLHFYTLNQSPATIEITQALGLAS